MEQGLNNTSATHLDSSPLVDGNEIETNKVTSATHLDSSPLVDGNEIETNKAASATHLDSSPLVDGNEIETNKATSATHLDSSPLVDGNEIETNKATSATHLDSSPLLGRGRGRLIILAAPSGSGKSTIKDYLMQIEELNLHFSISATSRAPRGSEQNGVEYFFMTPEEFRSHIEADDFIEYEEVYTDKYYGTLKSQVEKQLEAGENVLLDVDVKGALNIKKHYGKRALSLFIQPPSLEELRRRLEGRGTDAPEVIEQRLARAEFELSFADKFDEVVINDVLQVAQVEAEAIVDDFINEQ